VKVLSKFGLKSLPLPAIIWKKTEEKEEKKKEKKESQS